MTMAKAELVLNAKAEIGECPLWSVKEQCLYWIDVHGRSFHRFDPSTAEDYSWALPATPGSFVLRESGGIVFALSDGFYDFDPTMGTLAPLAKAPYEPSKVRFNDGRTDRQGRYWVGTVPIDPLGDEDGALRAYYSFDGRSVQERIAPIDQANGTAFSPDGRTMYRSEWRSKTILAYDLDPDSGDVTGERVFVRVPDELGGPDGAAVDSEGGYWAALPNGPQGGSVARFTANGKIDLVIEVPVLIPTMPAFGGPDMSTLYITSARVEPMLGKPISPISGGLFALETSFRGIAETEFRT